MDTDESEYNFDENSSLDEEDLNIDLNQEFFTDELSISELPNGKFSSVGKRTYGGVETEGHEESRCRLQKNLQALREILPGSSSIGTSAIIADAFKYIDKLRGRVGDLTAEFKMDLHAQKPQLHDFALPEPESLHQENNATDPLVQVIAHQVGMQIHVCCAKRPGMLVAILEALEKVGLNVMQASVVSQAQFILDALGADQCGRKAGGLKCQDVKNTILQTIKEQNNVHL